MYDMNIEINATLCFLILKDEVYLAKKFINSNPDKIGQEKYNGYGGTVENGETIAKATVREILEESHSKVKESDLDMRALIEFYFPHKPHKNQRVHIFFAKNWKGTPTKTAEMDYPKLFKKNNLPYSEMFASDKIWLERVMNGEKLKGYFIWNPDMSVKEYNLINVKLF